MNIEEGLNEAGKHYLGLNNAKLVMDEDEKLVRRSAGEFIS